MKNTKRLLAIVLSFMIIAMSCITTFAVSADGNTAFNLAPNTAVTANDDGSYNLIIANGKTNGTTSALLQPIDIKTQGFKFKFVDSASSSYEKGIFTISNSSEGLTNTSNNFGVPAFTLISQSTDLYRLAYSDDPNTNLVTGITKADVHEFGISKSGGNYWLSIDGINRVNITAKYSGIADLYNSGVAYLHFGTIDSDVQCSFNNIQVTQRTGFNTPPDTAFTKNDDGSYNLTIANGTINLTTSALLQPIDIKTQGFKFQFVDNASSNYEKGIFTISNSSEGLTNTSNNFGVPAFTLISQTTTTYRLAYSDAPTTNLVTGITKADIHEFGISKSGGSYWLSIDGVNRVDITAKYPGIADLYNSGEAYLHFGTIDSAVQCSFNNIQVTQRTGFNLYPSMTATDNGNGVYTIVKNKTDAVDSNTSVSYQSIDLKTQGFKFGFTSPNSNYGYAIFALTNAPCGLTSQTDANLADYKGVVFQLTGNKDNGTWRVDIYNNGAIATEQDKITYGEVHEFGISKSGGKWWLAVDGVNTLDISTTASGTASAIEALVESGKAYLHFGVIGSAAACTFSGIEVTERTGFNLYPSMTATDNGNGVYTIVKNATSAVDSNTSVSYQSIDLRNQSFKFAFASPNSNYGQGVIALTNSPYGLTGPDDASYGSVAFRLESSGTNWRLAGYNGGSTVVNSLANFTKTDVHEFSISKSGNQLWLTIDGINAVNLTTQVPVIASAMEALVESGKAYLHFGVIGSSAACTFSGIEITQRVGGVNAPTGVTVTGNETDGYTLTAAGGYSDKIATVFNNPIDIDTKGVSFAPSNFAYPVVFAITNTDCTLPKVDANGTAAQLEAAGAVAFYIYKNGVIQIWNGQNDIVNTGATVNLAESHIYSFVKEDGNWWLNIDGDNSANLTNIDTSGNIAKRLDALAASGKAYLQLGATTSTFTISNIKVCDIPKLSANSSITVTGDEINGYNLAGLTPNTSALIKKPIDIKTQQIEFSSNYINGKRLILFLQGDDKRGTAWKYDTSVMETRDMYSLHILNGGDKFVFQGYDGTNQPDYNTSYSKDSTSFTISFHKTKGCWWLTVNGENKVNLTEKDPNNAKQIDDLAKSGKAYLCFTAFGTDASYNVTNIKYSNIPEFFANNEIAISGDATNGYNLGGVAPNTSALRRTPIDIKTQQIEFTSNYINGKRLILFLQGDATRGTAWKYDTSVMETRDMYSLHILNGGDSFVFHGYDGTTESDYATSYSKDSTSFKIGFNKSGGNWWLTVNGDNKVNLTQKDPNGAKQIDDLAKSGEAYLCFTALGTDASYNVTNIKYSDMSEFFANSEIVTSGDATNGYNLEGIAQNTSALFKTPVDIKTQQFTFSSNYFNASRLVLLLQGDATRRSTSWKYEATVMETNDMFALHLLNGADNIVLRGYYGASTEIDYSITYPKETSLTIGFTKSGGNWWLTINGVNKVNLTAKDTELSINATKELDDLVESGEAYLHFAALGTDASYNVSGLKITDRTGFNLTPNMVMVDNGDGSYNIVKNKTDATNHSTSLAYQTTDLRTQAFKFSFASDSTVAKAAVSFTNAPCGLTGPEDASYGSVSFRLQQVTTTEWAIVVYNSNGEAVTKGVVAPRISKDAHIFGISYVGDNWWLTVDGVNTLNFDNTAPDVIPALQKLYESGKVYIQFGVVDSALRSTFNGIKTFNYKSADPNVDQTFDVRDMLALHKKLKTYYSDIRIDDYDENGTVDNSDLITIKTELLSEFVVYASDFGALPNDGIDDADAIRNAIVAVSEMGNGAALLLEKDGVYNIDTLVENTEFAFHFTGLNDVTILGDNTTFLLGNPKFSGFYFIDSKSITIKGITIDYAVKPWIQGTITAVNSSSNTFTIDTGKTDKTVFDFENWNSGAYVVGINRDDTDPTIHHTDRFDYFEGVTSVVRESEGSSKYTVTLNDNDQLTNGHIETNKKFVLLNRINTGGAFRFLRVDGDITIEKCNVNASAGAGLLAGFVDGDLKFIDSNIKPDDNNWIATNADGFYMHNIKGRFILTGSHIQGTGDDMINLHNTGMLIYNDDNALDNKILANYYHVPEAGDKIDIIDATNGSIKYKDVTITAVSAEYVEAASINRLTLTLDREVDTTNDKNGTRHGYVAIYQKAQSPGTVISNNTFCNNGRGGGIKVNARETKIMDNIFQNITGPAITLFDLPSNTEYGGAGDNITISGNTITDCGFVTSNANGVAKEKWSAIAVGTRQSTGDDTEAAGIMFDNVKILNNTITGVYKNGIYVSNAKNVTVSGNTINCDVTRGSAKSSIMRSAIAVNIVENIFVKNNTANYNDPPFISSYFKAFRVYAAYRNVVTANSSGNTYRGSSAEWSTQN